MPLVWTGPCDIAFKAYQIPFNGLQNKAIREQNGNNGCKIKSAKY